MRNVSPKSQRDEKAMEKEKKEENYDSIFSCCCVITITVMPWSSL